MINRAFPNIISTDLRSSQQWYQELLGWDTEFESDWFVHLKAAGNPMIELGIIAAGHDIDPTGTFQAAGSMVLTFVVDDVDSHHKVALDRGDVIVEPPTDLFYGQRRMVLQDPDGTFIDLSSDCAPSQEFLDSLPHLSEH